MCVLRRYRLAITIYAVLVFIVCDAEKDNEVQNAKLMTPRGNHWAVGHLMGKKSLDYDRDGGGERHFSTARADEKPDGNAKPSGLLRALATILAGPERETESVRKSEPNQGAQAQSRLCEEQLTRGRELKQVVCLLRLTVPGEGQES